MLEKIGLPAKPSMRGGNWVIDASHCQGCSSQFSFINRKHHCRRCGGIFCNSCTQQRMVLRGQGDSPVRICEPCKKLEEAARFELRYGHRSRPAKGSSKSSKHDEILNQILERNVNYPSSSSSRQTGSDVESLIEEASSSSANAHLQEENKTSDKIGDIIRSLSPDVQNDLIQETGPSSPEELRRQAAEQKKKYKTLKGEGKGEEALLAFKRGKELERQAGALEIALRKSRRLASIQKPNYNNVVVSDTKNTCSKASKVEKDDLASELKELGWSDADLHDSDKQKEKLSLEGELSSLLKETSEKSLVNRKTSGIDKTQVITHKKKALMLKREGKLAEAKQELKQAKILEKQLEEQELLEEAEDSDDELSSLIGNMDEDKQDDLSLDYLHSSAISFGPIADLGDDSTFDVNFDVTDDDMNVPEIASALKSFGWSEDDNRLEVGLQSVPADSEKLAAEVLSLKKEAIKQKQEGNINEAKELLKRVHLLEKDSILPFESQQSVPADPRKSLMPPAENVSSSTKARKQNTAPTVVVASNHGQRSIMTIQKELLALKKKALALKREGRPEEAEEELMKGKVIEQELEEMKKVPNLSFTNKNLFESTVHLDKSDETEVSVQDEKDPAILSLLENYGWKDETESANNTGSPSEILNIADHHKQRPRSKLIVQKELLSLKKKALSLKRVGRIEEAGEELRKGKVLEQELEEIERKSMPLEVGFGKKSTNDNLHQDNSVVLDHLDEGDATEATEIEMRDPAMLAILKNLGWKDDDDVEESAASIGKTSTDAPQMGPSKPMNLSRSKVEIQRELLIIKRSALALRRQGKAEEADEELRKAKDLESQLAELEAGSRSLPAVINSDVSELPLVDNSYQNTINVISDYPDRVQTLSTEHSQVQEHNSLKDQVLAHKRKAVAFKKEGKIVEAREELRQAKLLEKELEGDGQQANVDGKTASPSKILDETVKQESTQLSSTSQKPSTGRDRFKLQQESLAHKRKALKLRREGKTEEAEAELELAKNLESQLEDMDRNSPSTNKPSSNDDALVEDLLDPQLMSALKAIGWDDTEIGRQEPPKHEAKASTSKSMIVTQERAQLEEKIKAEKIRALNLKRSGKQNEALGALRSAKLLEKKLESLAP